MGHLGVGGPLAEFDHDHVAEIIDPEPSDQPRRPGGWALGSSARFGPGACIQS